MSPIETFRLDGPLPEGRLAIEASAGTGKTFTLSTLAARYVAEMGIPISDVLIVTFTRAAAAELKDRVRARLVDFSLALDSTDEPEDALLRQVRSVDRELRLTRVQEAITEFDSATITTIHGFAQQVIGTLGSTVPTDPDAVLVDDADTLARQVATDVLVAEAVGDEREPEDLPDLDTLHRSSGLAIGNPEADLVPGVDPEASSERAATLRTLVDKVVGEMTDRRRVAGTLSFDDLLVRLRAALDDELTAEGARRALSARYRVALIDEFQDTDPVQWAIFAAVFGHPAGDAGRPSTSLVLVGDPKQAIYAFRGANVHTYLQAAHAPDTELTGLGVNWRSDPAMLRALEVLLSGVTFGAEAIRFQPVETAPVHLDRVFADQDGTPIPAVSIRLTMGPGVPRYGSKTSGPATVEGGRAAVHREMATHIRELLETSVIPDGDQADSPRRRLRPDDVAVLIATNREGPAIRDALTELGIPAVISRGDSVLESQAAAHWHRLLAAVARPTDARRVRAAALSWFYGWDTARVANAGETELSIVQEQLHAWGETLSQEGVAAFIGRLWAESSVASLVLGQRDGDRSATDLEHIAELLSLAGGRTTSPTTLLATFEQLSGGDDEGNPEADIAARRVESESRAVQIMTTFVAKGLEFPVVCCPSTWESSGVKVRHNVWWDPEAGTRIIDVASGLDWGPEDALAERKARAAEEVVGSNLRVLYVALTRARHHVAIWWLPTKAAWGTGLGRVLFARDDGGDIDPQAFVAAEVEHLGEERAWDRLAPLLEQGGPDLEVVEVDDPGEHLRRWAGAERADATDLQVARLNRSVDRATSRWSFTAITSRAEDEHWGVDPFDDIAGGADEGREVAGSGPGGIDVVADAATDGAAPVDVAAESAALPLGDIAGGAGFGTLVHEVLENIDFTALDLENEISAVVADRLAWNPWTVDPDHLVEGLVAVVRTPLGPLFGNLSLADLPETDRLDEMTFDLTLGEGGARASDAAVGRMLLDHLPVDDPQRGWAERLADGPFSAVLAGHLTGSIDLVARIHGDDGIDRFVVCDYKTNRLAPPGVDPTADDFRPDRLPEAMAEHHYPLQALLYTVALHRYLRWRLPDDDPAVHLGGIGYLFVRGMVGPGTPTLNDVPYGLFEWRPSPELVTDLSDLLDGSLDTNPVGR